MDPTAGRTMEVRVIGTPAPEGSLQTRIGYRNGKPYAIVFYDNPEALRRWRSSIVHATPSGSSSIKGPVEVDATFYVDRPKDHFGTGRNAGTLRPSAPRYPIKKPDTDKLFRAVGDALTMAKVYVDDSQIVDIHARKRFADGRAPGAVIVVREMVWP